jgi:hypothetical protein
MHMRALTGAGWQAGWQAGAGAQLGRLAGPYLREVLMLPRSGTQQGESKTPGASWHLMSATPSPFGGPTLSVLFQDLQQPAKESYCFAVPSWQKAVESHSW